MKRMIIITFCLAALAAATALGLYAIKFGFGFASTIGDWGSVGDFFGGVLNPTFALLSLILIAYTLMQNKKALDQGALALKQSEEAIQQGTKALEQNEKALRVSNKELKLTREELANSSKALKEQASLLAVQSFETTFFNMLELHRRTLENIKFDANSCFSKISERQSIGSITANGLCHAQEAFASIVRFIKEIANKGDIQDYFEYFYTHEGKNIQIYFRNLYQALKFINDASFLTCRNKVKYSNLLRAQLSDEELVLVLLYCLNPKVNKESFKELIIKYSLFEPLDIIFSTDFKSCKIGSIGVTLTINSIHFFMAFDEQNKLKNSAFGKNEKIYSYCYEQGFLR